MKRFDGVSIIVPCYNVEKYLEQCVESLVNQTVDNYEVLLIDDGSTDQTPKMCDAFAKKYKNKVKAYHKKNGGLCDARNYGIKKASGKYLMFVDSDDWVTSNFVELPYNKAKEGYDIVSFDAIEIYDGATEGYHRSNFNGQDQEKKTFILNSTNPSFAWARLYDYRLFKYAMYPDPNIWYEDIATTPVLLSYANKITHIRSDLYYYRQRQGSISHESRNPKILGIIKACERSLDMCNKKFLPEVEFAIYQTMHEFIKFRPEYVEEYVEFIKKYPSFKENRYIQEKIATHEFDDLFEKKIVPKKIHYVWFGGEKPAEVLAYIETWKKYAPDYEIIEWNETNCDVNINNYVKEAYEAKKWAFVADYFRLKVLYEQGGIYLDTDMELKKNIDILRVHELSFPMQTNSICAGFIAACPQNKYIKEILDGYEEDHFLLEDGSYNFKIIVERITSVLEKYYSISYNCQTVKFPDLILYSPDLFTIDVANGKNIAEHHYKATWWDVQSEGSFKYEVLKYYFETLYIENQKNNKVSIKRKTYLALTGGLKRLLPTKMYKGLRKCYRKIKPLK